MIAPNPAAEAARAPLVRCEDLQKTYRVGGAPVRALRGVSLTITAGEFTAVVGPSGSGKSTLLHLLAGLDTPTAGRVWVEGREVGALPESARAQLRRERVGMVFQGDHLLARRRAWENVALPLEFQGRPPAERRARAEAALRRVGLAARVTHRPAELSGGERQRVALARALVAGPALLLCDEPTGSLDAATAERVLELLVEQNRELGVAVLWVTHHEALARRFARRLVRLADGAVIEDTLQVPADTPEGEQAE